MRLIQNDRQVEITVTKKMSLLSLLVSRGFFVSADCGGKGTCGRCQVTIEGVGRVLACEYQPTGEETVILPDREEFRLEEELLSSPKEKENLSGEYTVACDLGTTTLGFALINAQGEVAAQAGAGNPQRAYGSDVIARIQSAIEGQEPVLTAAIRTAILEGAKALCEKSNVSPGKIKRVQVAGNTVMEHLLLGLPVEGLGRAPYTPVTTEEVTTTIPIGRREVPMVLLPGISAFAGADLLGGMLMGELDRASGPVLLLDLGTNAEIALSLGEKIWVTSAPAGPALEGGNISCGIGAVPGAITSVELHQDGTTKALKTVDQKLPRGLCGSGLLDLCAELLRTKTMDANGLLKEPYFSQGISLYPGIVVTQKDIRELQKAKGAIGAGILCLLHQAGITKDDLQAFLVAGSFGFHVEPVVAETLGLYPEGLGNKVHILGNTSLMAAIGWGEELRCRGNKMKERIKEITLAEEPGFATAYMEQMHFPG